jgi:hypothetical protein
MLYSHAKQAEKESKKAGAHSWSWMFMNVSGCRMNSSVCQWGVSMLGEPQIHQTWRDQWICIFTSQTELSWCLCLSSPNPGLVTRTARSWSPTNGQRTCQGTEHINSQCTQSYLKVRMWFGHLSTPSALD